MGEIAEFMLEGGMCQSCGEIIDPPLGYPGYCAGCKGDAGGDNHDKYGRPRRGEAPRRRVLACGRGCGKKFRTEEAMQQHVRDVHDRKHRGVT
jgi:hypothetical protein